MHGAGTSSHHTTISILKDSWFAHKLTEEQMTHKPKRGGGAVVGNRVNEKEMKREKELVVGFYVT